MSSQGIHGINDDGTSRIAILKDEQDLTAFRVAPAEGFRPRRGRGSGDNGHSAVTGEIYKEISTFIDTYNPAKSHPLNGDGIFHKLDGFRSFLFHVNSPEILRTVITSEPLFKNRFTISC